MLSESQFDRIGQALVAIAQRMEHSLLTAMVEGFRAISPHASNAAANLRGKGMKSRELRQRASRDAAYRRAKSRQRGIYQRTCQQAINTARKEAAEAVPKEVGRAVREAHEGDKAYYRQAGQTPPPDDGLDGIIKDISGQTSAIMDTLLRSAAYRQPGGGYVKARDIFLREVERAANEMLSGNKTFDRAANEAVRGLAREGLKTVDYESGRVMQLDTAVRLNMQTAAAQANGRVSVENVLKTGTNHVEVSRHWGARTDGSGGHADHQAWQGQVYMVNGSDATYRNLTEATGYPGDLLGLFGYNCRHNMFPFWPGISTPNQWPDEPPPREYNGKTYTQTEATDRQRALERQIRALKREALACEAQGDKAAFSRIARRLKEREAEYKRFSEAMDIRAKVERCSVEGYNRSVAGKVTQAAKRSARVEAINEAISNSGNPKKLTGEPDERLKSTSPVDTPMLKGVVPKNANLTNVEVQAGNGTSTPIRDLARLYAQYPEYDPQGWQKKSGKTQSDNHTYTIHWYENNGFVPPEDVKTKGVRVR